MGVLMRQRLKGRRFRLAFSLAIVVSLASLPVAAVSTPAIAGNIAGVELCPQSICGQAVFAGNFAGTVKSKHESGVFWAGITHDALPVVQGQTAAITGGTWLIRTRTKVFTGTVDSGGTLTYNGDNTFDVSMTMVLVSGGTGTLTFTGLLDHNPFPPTIAGSITQ